MGLFIGIDLGTSGCRAVAIDEQRNIVGETSVALPAPQRRGAHIEQDPVLWWDAVCNCLECLSKTIDVQQVVVLAVDGTSGTLLLTNAQGTPLASALMYNDARATAEAETLARIAPANSAAHGPSCTLAKLMWLSQHEPAFAQTTHVCHQADWIAAKLSGRFGISDFNNALKLGFDAQQNKWPDWLTELDLPPRLFPKVVAPGTTIGHLAKDFTERFSLPETTRVVAGTTDSTASFLATGANKVGEAVTALGSTLVLKVISEKPIFAPEYGVYSQPLVSNNKTHWLVGGASNTGGNVLRQHFSLAQINAMTTQLKPDTPSGLNYYPLSNPGERFPINDSRLAAKLEPRPNDDVIFFQGMLEGIARIEAEGYRLLAELGAPYPVSIRTTGGGAKNTAWATIRKNLLGVEIESAQQTEAAFGVALLAATSND